MCVGWGWGGWGGLDFSVTNRMDAVVESKVEDGQDLRWTCSDHGVVPA